MKFVFFTTFKKIRQTRKMSQLLVLASFLISFALIRITTHLQKANIIPSQEGSLHIHHLVPGIILILISGYIGISFWNNTKLRWFMAIVFGLGAALTIDEFALWLFLKDVYWERQGRDSIDAIIIVATALSIVFAITEFRDSRYPEKIKNIFKK